MSGIELLSKMSYETLIESIKAQVNVITHTHTEGGMKSHQRAAITVDRCREIEMYLEVIEEKLRNQDS